MVHGFGVPYILERNAMKDVDPREAAIEEFERVAVEWYKTQEPTQELARRYLRARGLVWLYMGSPEPIGGYMEFVKVLTDYEQVLDPSMQNFTAASTLRARMLELVKKLDERL
jgi:hypothetical protein